MFTARLFILIMSLGNLIYDMVLIERQIKSSNIFILVLLLNMLGGKYE